MGGLYYPPLLCTLFCAPRLMPRKNPLPKNRNYVFTLNNPEGQLDPEEWPHCTYCIWQLEISKKGTPHFQGYIELDAPLDMRALHKFPGLESASFKKRMGTPEQARQYCTPSKKNKDKSKIDESYLEGPWEYGVMKSQGKRNDLIAVQEDIDAGYSREYVAQHHFSTFIRYNRGIDEYYRITQPPFEERKYSLDSFTIPPLDVKKATLIVGDSGLGKTEFAIAHFSKCLFVRHTDELLNLMVGFHDGIVFDEMDFSHHPTGARINLLDMERTAMIHCRYRHVKIPANMPRFFCHNKETIFYSDRDSIEERNAIDRRLRIVKVERKLFCTGSATVSSSSSIRATSFNDVLQSHHDQLINLYASTSDVVGSDVSSPDPYDNQQLDTGINISDLYGST